MDVQIDLELDVASSEAIENLMGTQDIRVGSKTTMLDDAIILEVAGSEEGLGFDESTLLSVVVSFGLGVSSGVVANAIYSSIGAHLRRISVGRRAVRPVEEEIEKAIELIRQIKENDK